MEHSQIRGDCHCGCGENTNIADWTDGSKGWIKGQPKRYIFGHSARRHLRTYAIESRGYLTPCWIWQGALHRGYAVFYEGGRHRRVHRLYYQAKYGELPLGTEPDHLCKIKHCVNPDHIEPVSHAENVRRGPHTKLTFEQVREIRRLATTGLYLGIQLSRMFNASPQTISLIVKGKQWIEKDVTVDLSPLMPGGNVGSNHRFTHLTNDDVIAIRSAYLKGHTSMRELANRYTVSVPTISNIVNLVSWRHIGRTFCSTAVHASPSS